MNETSRPEEETSNSPELCSCCLKLIAELKRTGGKIPPFLACAYGHRLIEFPKNCYEPERLPAWAWANPITISKGA